MSRSLRFLVILTVTATLATAGRAQETADPEEFDVEATVEICATCHGEEGVPEDREIPILWGQQFYYIYVQLRDYQAGRRANDIMSVIASEFDRDQMKALAQYFADKEWPRIDAQAGEAAAQGRSSLSAGQCAQCHNTYFGDSRIPRLAGQHPEYLARTMLEFKQKIRLNSAAKGTLLASFDDAQIEAMARYLAGL